MHPPKTPVLTDAAASFACPSCRALYEVSVQRLSLKDKGKAHCFVCGEVMTEWTLRMSLSFGWLHDPHRSQTAKGFASVSSFGRGPLKAATLTHEQARFPPTPPPHCRAVHPQQPDDMDLRSTGVPGFRSQDVAERFGCSPAYVRKIRAKMRKASLIRNEPADELAP